MPTTDEVFISCDPTTAFDLLADVRNEARWSDAVSSAVLQGDGPIGRGSNFVTVYRGMENRASLVEFDRPERAVVTSSNDKMDIDVTYVLAPAGGGTRVSVSSAVRPKGLLSILSPLIRLAIRRELKKKLAVVKQACETEAAASLS